MKSYIFTSICLKKMLFANPQSSSATCTQDCDISTRGDSLWLSGTWEESICSAVDLFVSIHVLKELQIVFFIIHSPKAISEVRNEQFCSLIILYMHYDDKYQQFVLGLAPQNVNSSEVPGSPFKKK